MIRIAVLGSTGSVGTQALEVIDRHPGKFSVAALTAHSNAELLIGQAHKYRPAFVGLTAAKDEKAIRERLPSGTALCVGEDCLVEAAALEEADTVLIATVGFSGLPPLMRSIQTDKRIALANKESIVCGGSVVMSALKEHGQCIYPIDSEHSAIFQCMEALSDEKALSRIVLTASGGPFRNTPAEQLHGITPGQAVRHPRWNMGKKISVDSATLMNKGFEVIEAHWLFGAPVDAIDVVIHPESIVHSLIELKDGSVLAQLGVPDMRVAIQYALSHPERLESGVARLDLIALASLHFEAPQEEKFPCLGLAYEALRAGGVMPAVLNAANEVAVDLFLNGRIGFTDIPRTIEYAMSRAPGVPLPSLDDICQADAVTRALLHNRRAAAPDGKE